MFTAIKKWRFQRKDSILELPSDYYAFYELDYFNFGAELAKNIRQSDKIRIEDFDDIDVQLYKTNYDMNEIYLGQLLQASRHFIPKINSSFAFSTSKKLRQHALNILKSCKNEQQKNIARLKLEAKIVEEHLYFHSSKYRSEDAKISTYATCGALSNRLAIIHATIARELIEQDNKTKKTEKKVRGLGKVISLIGKVRGAINLTQTKDIEEITIKEIKNLKMKLLSQDTVDGIIKIQQVIGKKFQILADYYHDRSLTLMRGTQEIPEQVIQKKINAEKEAGEYAASVAALIYTVKHKENNNALHITTPSELFTKIFEYGNHSNQTMKLRQGLPQLLSYVNQFFESYARNIDDIQNAIAAAASNLNDVELSALKNILSEQEIVNLIKAGCWAASNSSSTELNSNDLGLSQNTIQAAYMGSAFMISTIHDLINNELYGRALKLENTGVAHSTLGKADDYQQIDFMNFEDIPNRQTYVKMLEPYALKLGLDKDEEEKAMMAPILRPN